MNNNNLKDFIVKHKDLINDNRFDELYDEVDNLSYSSNSVRPYELTDVLYAAGIDPIPYLTTIPEHYMTGMDWDKITLPDNIIGINGYAFTLCSIKILEIMKNEIAIINNAFSDAKIGRLYLPKDVHLLGYMTFKGADIDTIIIDTLQSFEDWGRVCYGITDKGSFYDRFGLSLKTKIYTAGELK